MNNRQRARKTPPTTPFIPQTEADRRVVAALAAAGYAVAFGYYHHHAGRFALAGSRRMIVPSEPRR